jgi:ribose transport system permease protein
VSAKDSLQQPAPSTSALPIAEWLERFALVLVWAATIAVFGALRPETFLTWSTFSTILGSQAVIVILALGLVVPLTCND